MLFPSFTYEGARIEENERRRKSYDFTFAYFPYNEALQYFF
jgi:hypothetical protein